MEFKKTIAAVAFTASSLFALTPPPVATKTICLRAYDDNQGSLFAGNCDEARNNKIKKLPILSNGCAAEQIALRSVKYGQGFDIEIRNCLPPNVVQL